MAHHIHILKAADQPTALVEHRAVVGVAPAHAAKRHRRLLRALEAAFPVEFDARGPAQASGWEGLLLLGGDGTVDLAGVSESCALLVVAGVTSGRAARSELVEFADAPRIAYPLRGRTLKEDTTLPGPTAGSVAQDVVLARAGGIAAWWCTDGRAWRHESGYPLGELGDRETLRDHFKPGRFMGLLPLLHLLWHVCGDLHSGPPPLRASFVVDDPNLHWPSYGHLRYAALARHAAEHGYHVGLAMVPLDAWLVNRRAAALLRANEATTSLLLHGNNHTSRELGKLATDLDATLVLAQGLRRVARFERQSRLRVSRVMAPPHGACSEAAARAMFRLGFDAVCVSRPYPWRDDLRPLSGADGWFPAEMAAGGLPVLPRYLISSPREDLIFRALLRQPLILYGHHGDLADGLDTFALAARDVNRLGDVSWGPLDAIAEGNYVVSRDGSLLRMSMHSRRASVEVPEGVERLLVRIPVMHGDPLWSGLRCDAGEVPMMPARQGWSSQPVAVIGGSRVALSLSSRQPPDPDLLPTPRTGAWPILRRLLVECRDRGAPFASRRG